MDIGANGLALIKGFEGFRADAYLDSGGIPTIGYGTTKGVHMGMVINEAQAVDFLHRDVQIAINTLLCH